jgi:hypothetical protein
MNLKRVKLLLIIFYNICSIVKLIHRKILKRIMETILKIKKQLKD